MLRFHAALAAVAALLHPAGSVNGNRKADWGCISTSALLSLAQAAMVLSILPWLLKGSARPEYAQALASFQEDDSVAWEGGTTAW